MKRSHAFLSLLIVVGLIYFSFSSLMPRKGAPSTVADTEFSAERALVPLKEISKEPHFTGTSENVRVREYLVEQLKELGLEPQLQEGFILNSIRGRSLVKPVNILARIEGTDNTRALLVFSHYDSARVPSHGASDAGSGVVTILESLRAYQASDKVPKNDIIILFTDSEELGLDGAKLFMREHPWAKDVGLSLNFEARGSGGPSNMIIETNGGNSRLVEEFKAADTEYPVASSLMYSIYKMLPNDTDSTILREEGDIEGFFFAFIDDHFDYHTANDSYENLDRNSLQHQGSYLLPTMIHFADADLSTLKSDVDHVYVNFPFIKMISYPFAWIIPMLILAFAAFILLLVFGLRKRSLSGKDIARGFIPFLVSLVVCSLIGMFGWKLLLWLYPGYGEIQHGFTYNGHSYIAFFVMLSLGILFMAYRRLGKTISPANLLIAPLLFWLLINAGLAFFLEGAAYFIIPIYFALIALWLMIRQEKPNLLLLSLLAVPAIFLFSPLIQFFPVGLGLKMLFASCLFTVLSFGLMLPVFGYYKWKRTLSVLFFILAFVFFVSAHFKSGFSEERQKPNSLVYYKKSAEGNAYWVTYDNVLDAWTKTYLGDSPEEASKYVGSAAGSKYNTGYTFASPAPQVEIPEFEVRLEQDTVVGNEREVRFTILPNRAVNIIRLYSDQEQKFKELGFNGKLVPNDSTGTPWGARQSNYLMQYYRSGNDSLEVYCKYSAEVDLSFNVLEYSFDMMKNSRLKMKPRPATAMPSPFINTDAVVIEKAIRINDLKMEIVNDTLISVADE